MNQGKEIKYLQLNWPFLFEEIGMNIHFNELTGVDMKETFFKNVEQKGERLLHFMKTVAVNKSKTQVTEMVLLLLAYFDERDDVMFH